MNYGHRYRAARYALDLTQEKICEKLEIKQADWSYLERCGKRMDIEICEGLINLGVNPLFLITGEPPVLLPHVKVLEHTGPTPHLDGLPSPIAFLETLKETQEANELEIRDWQKAYKRLAEEILPIMRKMDLYLSQLAGKKFMFNLIQT